MRYAILLALVLLLPAVQAVMVEQEVAAALDSKDEVPVIVTLKKGSAPLEIEGQENLGIINGFSGNISKNKLNQLKTDFRVSGIELDTRVSIMLSESAPLTNANQLWPLSIGSVNITGRGETVCVIDTGVDYTHPALSSRFLGGYDFVNNDNNSMDDNGHGTHVAGIIASTNQTYRGIAPEAGLVGIKALDSGGNGFESDVIAGMNWCVANATAYNISVISMSLGGETLYTGYCDANETAFSTAVNAAVAKNISVVVASGNDASNISMAAPGCIQNATSVGSVYDANVGGLIFSVCTDSSTAADKIACYTNRNSILDLLAPGSRITSTNDGGGFVTQDGTSMATPHVSAAFALVRQFKRLENGTLLNPAQIENILKSRGTNISDSRTGLNFSRINILASIRSIDTTVPLLSIASPQNNTYNATNISLSYSASDLLIDTCLFTNTTGINVTLTGCPNITFLAEEGQNNISVIINDTNGNTNTSHVFFTVDATYPLLSVSSPQNTTYLTTNVSVNYSASDARIDRCWFVNTTGGTIFTNSPRGACNNSSVITGSSQYNMTIYANDSAGNINYTQIFFTVDPMPLITFVAPTPANQTLDTTNDLSINITSNKPLSAALLEWNGTNITMNGSLTSWTYSFSDLADGNYTYKVYANDSANNMNSSDSRWIFINATRNVSSYIDSLNASIPGVELLNSSGSVSGNVFTDINYTLRFNVTGIFAEIGNFSWLDANTSNLVNVTRNITLSNISTAFNTSGGLIDNYIWIDVNNFTTSYTPQLTFQGTFRLAYYINGSRESPDYRRLETCNSNNSNLPCFSSGSSTIIRLASFSGGAVGNDTQNPGVTISLPAGTYSESNLSLNYSVSDNIAMDRCSYSLNGAANVTVNGCTNTTIIAASGSNTLVLFANDTSGNINSTSVSFTYSAPAVAATSSGGGGGGSGGGGAAPPQNVYTRSFASANGIVKTNVTLNSVPLRSVILYVNGTARNAVLSISPELKGRVELENVYQYFSVNLTRMNITSAEIIFRVNMSWIESNDFDMTMVKLNRFSNGWAPLDTFVLSENSTQVTYLSITPGFSTFAITGQPRAAEPYFSDEPIIANTTNATVPEANETRVCIQVITPAIRNNECVLYSSPCDVPEGWIVVDKCPSNQDAPLALVILALIITAALAFYAGRKIHVKGRRT